HSFIFRTTRRWKSLPNGKSGREGRNTNVACHIKRPTHRRMYQRIAHISLVVEDYDEAIEFYTKKLDFQLLEDTKLSEEKRWVVVAPNGAKECSLLLAKAANERQAQFAGNQTGGRV